MKNKSLGLIYGLFVVLSVSYYFVYFPIPYLFLRVKEMLFLLLIYFAALTTGLFLTRRVLKITALEFTDHLFIVPAVGLGLFTLLIFLLGILQSLYVPVIFSTIIILGLVCLVIEKSTVLSLIRRIHLPFTLKISGLQFIVLVTIVSAIGLCLITCFAPPTYYDTLVYHLALPDLYLRHHRIEPVPGNVYANFPANIETMFILGLATGDEVMVNLLTLLFSLITGGIIYLFTDRYFFITQFSNPVSYLLHKYKLSTSEKNNIDLIINVKYLTILFFCTTPAVLFLSTGGYVESGVAMFLCLSVYTLFRAKDQGLKILTQPVTYTWKINQPLNKLYYEIYTSYLAIRKIPDDLGWLVLSGIFMGLAIGSKYTAGVAVIPLAIIIFILSKPVKLFLWISIVGITFLPWLIKNWVYVGNPVYPFLYDWFPGKDELVKIPIGGYFSLLTEYLPRKEIIWEIITFPWRFVTQTIRYGGGFDVLGGLGWIPYLLFVPGILLFRLNRIQWILIFYVFGFGVIWFFTAQVARFIYPLIPILCLFAGWVTVRLITCSKYIRYLVYILLFLILTSQLFIYFYTETIFARFLVGIGIQSREEYLATKINVYPVFTYINRNLPVRKTKILFIGEQRGFYCHRDYIPNYIFMNSPYAEWANRSLTVDELLTQLKNQQITHILVSQPEMDRLKSYRNFVLTEHGKTVHFDLINTRLKIAYEHQGVRLYSL